MNKITGDQNCNDCLEIWFKVILDSKINVKPGINTASELKNHLETTFQDKLETVSDQWFPQSSFKFDNQQFLDEIVKVFSKYAVHEHGFYPKGIQKFEGFTCAGCASLVSHLLTRKGIEHYYARPVGHSVNVIVEGEGLY